MAVSKSSMAIDSFLEYFKDAKPYHTKLLEIIEEYNFTENMYVIMSDSVEQEITIQNDPLCKLTGFGIDYDDKCGYDAIDCCDLFDCTGGYGYIFDNSDLLVEETIIDKDNDEGKLIVSGNQLADTRIPVISVTSPTNFTLEGDATSLLDTHTIGIFVNVLQFDVVSNDSSTIKISGNHESFIETKSNFRIEGTETQYNGTYTVLSTSYDVTNDETVITFSYFKPVPDNVLAGLKVQFRNSNPNGGIYQVDSYSYNGTNTDVTITNDTFSNVNPDESRLGSFQFRTGLRYPREVEIDTATVPYHNILFSDYDYNNNRTQIYVDEDISSYTVGVDTVKLYGYFFGSGYDGNEECTKPKDTHVYSKLEEDLIIEIDDSLIPPPSQDFLMFSNEANYRMLPVYEVSNSTFEEDYRLDVRNYYIEDNQSVSANFDAPDGNNFLHGAYFYANSSGDGSRIALYDYGPPYVTLFDTSTMEPITPNLEIDDFESNWHQTTGAINEDGTLLTAGGYRTSDGTFVERVYQFDSGSNQWNTIEEIADGDTDVWSTQNTFYFLKNDTEIIFPLSYSPSLSNSNAIFRVYDLSSSSFINVADAVSPSLSDGSTITWTNGCMLTDDEQYLIVMGDTVTSGFEFFIYETTNWTLHNLCLIENVGFINSFVISSYDDNLYFTVNDELRYASVDDVINTTSVTSTLFIDDGYGSSRLYISPDGKLLSCADISFEDFVLVYSIETGSLVKQFDSNLQIQYAGLFSNFTPSYTKPSSITVDSSSNAYGLGVEWIGRLGTGRNGSYLGLPSRIGLQDGQSSEWTKVSTGTNTTLGILTDGTLWGAGPTWDATLATELDGDRQTFFQIGTDTWKDVGISKDGQSNSDTRDDVAHAAGIKTDGTLWVWGISFSASYATDANDYIRTPVQLGTDTDWDSVDVGKTAQNGGYLIKTDGSLWRWSDSTPVFVDAGSWSKVRSINRNVTALALKNDGTIHEISSGDSITQVGTDTDWTDIDVCITRAKYAIKSDGTMYVWDNSSGDDFLTGNGIGTGALSSPTQIGTDTNWLTVTGGKHHVLALKTDGSLWGWGKNTGYALGDLGTLDAIIEQPTQIGSETGFINMDAGLWHNVIWKVGSTPTPTPTPSPVISGTVLHGSTSSPYISAFDLYDGTLLWEQTNSSFFSSPRKIEVHDDIDSQHYYVIRAQSVTKARLSDGVPVWNYDIGITLYGIGLDNDGNVWLQGQFGKIRKLSPDGVSLAQYSISSEMGGTVQNIIRGIDHYNGNLYFAMEDNGRILKFNITSEVVEATVDPTVTTGLNVVKVINDRVFCGKANYDLNLGDETGGGTLKAISESSTEMYQMVSGEITAHYKLSGGTFSSGTVVQTGVSSIEHGMDAATEEFYAGLSSTFLTAWSSSDDSLLWQNSVSQSSAVAVSDIQASNITPTPTPTPTPSPTS